MNVQAASTGREVSGAVAASRPGLVILDVRLADPSAYEVCRELREHFGERLPIVLTSDTRTEPHDEIVALLLGADDYFARPLSVDRFVVRVRRLLTRAPASTRSPLTRRESEVLRLLVDGYRSAQIAALLCISRKTTSAHIEHILAKLGAHSQAQAVVVALRDHVLDEAVSPAV